MIKIDKIGLIILGITGVMLFFSSCAPLNPSIMFKTPKGYAYDQPTDSAQIEYRIAANDVISFRLFTNNGFKLVNISAANNIQIQNLNTGIDYLVEYDGKINLPIIGRVEIKGLTLREAEFLLESKYQEVYIDPFILLNIANRRVTIFPGNGGNGRVIPLENNNVTLLEALAQAGGITETGRAKRVKLIRGDLNDPQVFLIDLSTIQGVSKGNIILQANDIIYVEPVGVTRRQVLSELSPILSFLTSLITLYIIIDRVEN